MSALDRLLAGPVAQHLQADPELWFRVLDTSGAMLYVSANVEKFLGYTPEELMGRNVHELLHPDEVHIGPAAGKAMADGPIHAIYRMKHKDGHFVWVSTYAQFVDGLVLALGRAVPVRMRGVRWEHTDPFV